MTSRRRHALELVLDDTGDAAVRGRWDLLEAAGVPSMARHTGATHRPHVTVASGPPPTDEVLAAAERLVVPHLPLPAPVPGLALLGPPSRATLVELLALPEELRAAREELVALWRDADDRPWLPHLTLAQRLPPETLAAALEALAHEPAAPAPRCLVGLRWWDPDRGTTVPVGGRGDRESTG